MDAYQPTRPTGRTGGHLEEATRRRGGRTRGATTRSTLGLLGNDRHAPAGGWRRRAAALVVADGDVRLLLGRLDRQEARRRHVVLRAHGLADADLPVDLALDVVHPGDARLEVLELDAVVERAARALADVAGVDGVQEGEVA